MITLGPEGYKPPILVVFDQGNGSRLFRGCVSWAKVSSFQPLNALRHEGRRYFIERVFSVIALTGQVFTFIGARLEPVPEPELVPRPLRPSEFLPPPRRTDPHLHLV